MGTPIDADTSRGRLRGVSQDGLRVFRGVPFAEPPIGALRFAAPRPLLPWAGLREATARGPVARQLPGVFDELLGYDFDRQDEDCLYLDAWVPEGLDGPAPVMVWIPGGAFLTGGGSLRPYTPAGLALRGRVIVVTINYRLGVLGFLHGRTVCGDALPSSGNQGLLDQVAALQWVRDEIAAFGGDPGKVTVFGESAGAVSISTLLGLPAARGLFHRAIIQSGTAHLLRPLSIAQEMCGRVLEHFGLAPAEAGQLYAASAESLLEAQGRAVAAMQAARPAPLPISPVVDGDVLPRSPVDAVAAGEAAAIPLMVGTTADEYRLFSLVDPGAATLDEGRLVSRVRKRLEGREDLAREVVAFYRDFLPSQGKPNSHGDCWFAIETGRQLFHPAAQLAELHSKHSASTYSYVYTRPSPYADGALGACHTVELPFIFGSYTDPAVSPYSGTGPGADRVAAMMQDTWSAFARSGNPNNASIPHWPRYEPGARATMLLGDAPAVALAPREAERLLWERIAAEGASGLS
jgi:para-nitrobenzyl esterase